MKKISILISLLIALVSTACQSKALAENTSRVSQKTDPDLIKNATLLIVVENIQKKGVTLGYDIATLVQYQGETYLVTHNHWEEMLQGMNIVELRDAQKKMLCPIYASEFKSLIVYQDAGTMVLRLPDGLPDSLTPADLDPAPQVKPGETVQVAHWSYPNRDQVEITDAIVVEVSTLRDVPVYTLRNLNGQPLHPGDSGGGVWYKGKLVANTWTVLTNVSTTVSVTDTVISTSETLTDLSHAAIFPEGFTDELAH